ncbi:MAG: biopolymer transporter ExbD, partial [Planctomycetota bacterium]|nr:biopolymer transporter ExbD [Planctomycetota bacterium]
SDPASLDALRPHTAMLTLRRPQHETRVEIMPLIDVIFLLLTFFIYSMVLTVRADLLPMQMQAFASGEPATVPPAVTISIDHAGALFFNREPISLDQVLPRLRELQADAPDTVVYIAAQEHGTKDRLPTFLSLYDKLAFAGLDIKLVGAPSQETTGQGAPDKLDR